MSHTDKFTFYHHASELFFTCVIYIDNIRSINNTHQFADFFVFFFRKMVKNKKKSTSIVRFAGWLVENEPAQDKRRRRRDNPLPGADPGDRGPGALELGQGHGVALPLGADPPAQPAAAPLREGLRALEQHQRVPQLVPQDDPADHQGVGAQHEHTLHQVYRKI